MFQVSKHFVIILTSGITGKCNKYYGIFYCVLHLYCVLYFIVRFVFYSAFCILQCVLHFIVRFAFYSAFCIFYCVLHFHRNNYIFTLACRNALCVLFRVICHTFTRGEMIIIRIYLRFRFYHLLNSFHRVGSFREFLYQIVNAALFHGVLNYSVL